MKKFLAIALIWALAALPVRADFGAGNNLQGFWAGSNVELVVATCATSASDLTTYSDAITLPGVGDGESVLVVAVFLGEDSANTFGVNSATFDGSAATEIADFAGSGQAVSAAVYQLRMTGAASVTVAPTYSEAITSNTTCLFAFRNLVSDTATAVTAAGSGTPVALTLGSTTLGGYAVGACLSATSGSSFTWGVLTEIQDTNNGEVTYSNASGVTTGASMSVTCDAAAGADSGAAAAYR